MGTKKGQDAEVLVRMRTWDGEGEMLENQIWQICGFFFLFYIIIIYFFMEKGKSCCCWGFCFAQIIHSGPK